MILDGTFLRKLEQLSLVARRVRAGQVAGERRSTRRGASVEFADYRDYAQGDDLRRVDWNIYARLERPFVKLFEEEEDLAVHLLLDGSGSMDWGEGSRQVDEETRKQVDKETRKQVDKETSRQGNKGRSLPLSPPMGGALPSSPPMGGALPSPPPMGGPLPSSPPMGGALPLSPPMGGTEGGDENKWLYARRLAAALGYVALVTGDRLTIANLQSPISNLQPPISNLQFDPVRGRGHALRLFEWLEGLKAGGATDLNASLRGYAISGGRPGLVVLVSDLFSPLYSEGSKAAPIHSEGSEAAPTGYVEGLTRLAARGHEIAVIHVLPGCGRSTAAGWRPGGTRSGRPAALATCTMSPSRPMCPSSAWYSTICGGRGCCGKLDAGEAFPPPSQGGDLAVSPAPHPHRVPPSLPGRGWGRVDLGESERVADGW